MVVDNSDIWEDNIISRLLTPEILLLAVPKSFKVNDNLSDFRLTAEDIREHKHLKKAMVSLNAFKDEPFILLNPENDTGIMANKLF